MSNDMPDIRTFDVLKSARGTTYPSKDVEVYTDQGGAFEIVQLERQISDTKDPDEVDRLDAMVNELRKQVKDSALTFHMRGIGPGIRAAVEMRIKQTTGLTEEERVRLSNSSYLAEHIVRVTNAAGEVDERMWAADDVAELIDVLPDESVAKLFEAMGELTFRALYFDDVVSADFLPTS